MFGIVSSLVLLAMFILMLIEEHTHIRNCRALYQECFSIERLEEMLLYKIAHDLILNEQRAIGKKLKAIANELSLHTNTKYAVVQSCITGPNQLLTLHEATLQLQRIRATAF